MANMNFDSLWLEKLHIFFKILFTFLSTFKLQISFKLILFQLRARAVLLYVGSSKNSWWFAKWVESGVHLICTLLKDKRLLKALINLASLFQSIKYEIITPLFTLKRISSHFAVFSKVYVHCTYVRTYARTYRKIPMGIPMGISMGIPNLIETYILESRT